VISAERIIVSNVPMTLQEIVFNMCLLYDTMIYLLFL